MKYFLTSALILLSLNIFGQMRHEQPIPTEVKSASLVLGAGFATNETLMHCKGFQSMTEVEQYQMATKVYFSAAIFSVATYFGTRYYVKNKRKIKRFFKLNNIFHGRN